MRGLVEETGRRREQTLDVCGAQTAIHGSVVAGMVLREIDQLRGIGAGCVGGMGAGEQIATTSGVREIRCFHM